MDMQYTLETILNKQFNGVDCGIILLAALIGKNPDSNTKKEQCETLKRYYTEYEMYERNIKNQTSNIEFSSEILNCEIERVKRNINYIQILNLQYKMELDIIPFINDFLEKVKKNKVYYKPEEISEKKEEEKFCYICFILVVKLLYENYKGDIGKLANQYDEVIEQRFYEYMKEKELFTKYGEEASILYNNLTYEDILIKFWWNKYEFLRCTNSNDNKKKEIELLNYKNKYIDIKRKLENISDETDKERLKKIIIDIRKLEFNANQYIKKYFIPQIETINFFNLDGSVKEISKIKVTNYRYYIEYIKLTCKKILGANIKGIPNILYSGMLCTKDNYMDYCKALLYYIIYTNYNSMCVCKHYIENSYTIYKEIKSKEFKKLCIGKGRSIINTAIIKEVMKLLSDAGMDIVISGDIIRYNVVMEDILVAVITQGIQKDSSSAKMYFYDVVKCVIEKCNTTKEVSGISSVMEEWREDNKIFKAEIFNCISKYIIDKDLNLEKNCINMLEKWNDISSTQIVTAVFWAISEYMNEIIIAEPKKQDIEAWRSYQHNLSILDRFIEYFIKLAKYITYMPAAYFAIEVIACCPVIDEAVTDCGKDRKNLRLNRWKILETMLETLELINWSEILENVKPDEKDYSLGYCKPVYEVCVGTLKEFYDNYKTGTGKGKEALYYQRLCKAAMYLTYKK